jgi:hypothetical protein
MSRGRNRKHWNPRVFTTHVLALAKPLSVSRGRVDDVREEEAGLSTQQMTA